MRGDGIDLAILAAELWSLISLTEIRPHGDSPFSKSANGEGGVDPKIRANTRGIYNVQPWMAEQTMIGIDNPSL